MENEKRLLVAIALSVLVIFMYQGYMRRYYKPSQPQAASPQPSIVNQEPSGLKTRGAEAASQTRRAQEVVAGKRSDPVSQEQTVVVENELYRAVLTDQGAGIKEFYLLQFKDKEGTPTLLSRADKDQPLVLEAEETSGAARDRTWQLLEHTDNIVVYKSEDDLKRTIKSYKFHDANYIVELRLNILNKAPRAQEVRYKITGGSGIISTGPIDSRYFGADAQIGDKIYRRKPSHKSLQEGELFYGSPDWVSAKSRYFSYILKPSQPAEAAFIESADKKSISSGVILGPLSIAPNEAAEYRFMLYAGPNTIEKMSALGPTVGNTISYGVFSGIANLMLKGLKLFHRIFGNYGVAIIMLSILTSLLMFPLTRKSLQSMKEMQKIQPEVEQIRKAQSDNPQKMNKEIMGLYKEHKVNPLGGCLPIFLQFPIFISLYQTLIRCVELKGAHFLWIKDLSAPDEAFKLPQKLPVIGDYINILPILMVAAMAVQQKVSQPKGAQQSEQQRIMSTIFPVFLGLIFYGLPSGLVLYWLTNTLLMLLMQEVVLKSRQPA